MLFDFASGRHRIEENAERWEKETGRLYAMQSIYVFDGQIGRSAAPRELNQNEIAPLEESHIDLVNLSGDLRREPFEVAHYPLFFGHGTVPSFGRVPYPGRLAIHPPPEDLFVHGRAVHVGRNCLVLRTFGPQAPGANVEEFWVDPERDSAILRSVLYGAGKPIWDVDIAYQQTVHGWLPARWTMVNKGSDGMTTSIERLRVDRIEVDPAFESGHFQIKEQPGWRIMDIKYSDVAGPVGQPRMVQQLFVVGNDGRWNAIGQGAQLEAGRHHRLWWLLALVVVGTIGMYLFAQRRRRSLVETEKAAQPKLT